jgi:hypothetical protein
VEDFSMQGRRNGQARGPRRDLVCEEMAISALIHHIRGTWIAENAFEALHY